MKDILNYLFEHKTLSKDDAKNVFISLSKDKFNHNQIHHLTNYCGHFPSLVYSFNCTKKLGAIKTVH